MATRYYLSLPDASALHAAGPFAFRSHGAEGVAAELQDALRSDALFLRWRMAQDDPDGVDPMLGARDADATVVGRQQDLHIDLEVVTSIASTVLKHRLRLLAGSEWRLHDVTAA